MSAEEYLACRSGAVIHLWEPRQAYFGALGGGKRAGEELDEGNLFCSRLMDKYSKNARFL